MKLSSSTLRKAADLQERIEALQKELAALLQTQGAATGTSEREKTPAPSGPGAPQRRTRLGSGPALASKGFGRRRGSPSGPLSTAVVQVLKTRGVPMRVAEIFEDLIASGYQYTSPEPKKNLSARIYHLKGVKQVGRGRFAPG
ncbi:MAG: hypothetical protein JO069_06570 [Verrucomicrobia bacterium]|nr:hypothetical protein [Verrucomicrobiota bacterium]